MQYIRRDEKIAKPRVFRATVNVINLLIWAIDWINWKSAAQVQITAEGRFGGGKNICKDIV